MGEGALCPRYGDKATRVPVHGAQIWGAMGRFPVPFGVVVAGICRSGSTGYERGARGRLPGEFHGGLPRRSSTLEFRSRIGLPDDIRTGPIHALLFRPNAAHSK
ncbi:MAG: hypothetical protein RI986_1450 [Planctomycetota bacterium]